LFIVSIFKAPSFWYDDVSPYARILLPFAKIYEFASRIKTNSTTPEKARVPVVCVGNVVLGGAGKTPTVEMVCDILKKSNFTPNILTGGYGGYLKNVVKVDVHKHSYLQVGDEALLSALVYPTWVGKNRIHSADADVLSGATVLVMDDGFQNNSIYKEYKILVIDSGQKFGNRLIFPAGPLRESIESGVQKSDVILIIGESNQELEEEITSIKDKIPIFYTSMEVSQNGGIEKGDRVIGFCGLGYPAKFLKTLKMIGADVVDFVVFPDHHPYTITEVQRMIKAAKSTGTKLVTTRKDYIKIPDVFKSETKVVDIKLSLVGKSFEDDMIKHIS
jgi:tetraacyldisaccharide 4'-kinase